MSVFGGDSWGREAQHRKRRVEDVVTESIEGSSYKKLSNGKYACLLCPNTPVLDTPLMLSTHCKGSRHRAAESRLKERDLARREEANKRIALAEADSIGGNANSATRSKRFKSSDDKLKPVIIGQVRKAAACGIVGNKMPMQDSQNKTGDDKLSANHLIGGASNCQLNVVSSSSSPAAEASDKVVGRRYMDYRECRERELKFTAAGWKRDCHGKWYKDENVEFDSDEEDPNVSFG